MRALVLDCPGTPETLRLTELPVPGPRPGPGEGGGARAEPGRQSGRRRPSGLELAACPRPGRGGDRRHGGRACDRRTAGAAGRLRQRPAPPGGVAEYTLAEAAVLAPVPATPGAATAAALPCAGMTAHQAIVRRLHVTSADTVLVTGGADGAGGFAVQFAARAGARVITTASAHKYRAHVSRGRTSSSTTAPRTCPPTSVN